FRGGCGDIVAVSGPTNEGRGSCGSVRRSGAASTSAHVLGVQATLTTKLAGQERLVLLETPQGKGALTTRRRPVALRSSPARGCELATVEPQRLDRALDGLPLLGRCLGADDGLERAEVDREPALADLERIQHVRNRR